MFTLKHLQAEAQKVKTGADFPKFIKQLKEMGVSRNDVYVMDGMAVYYGDKNHTVETGAAYENLLIAEKPSASALKEALNLHQQGQTDFFTFCKQAAEAGVEKWKIDLNAMTVSYLAMNGAVLLTEEIPEI